jgi:SAM-dependent methyltransferase
MTDNMFNEDYYENGITKGISGYQNYCWIPHRSYSEATEIVARFSFDTILDSGCAKGFLVHALRQLGKQAYGEDISEYALGHCFPGVEEYVSKPSDRKVDFVFSKDVLEHVPLENLFKLLIDLRNRCNQALFVIPLGDHGIFRIKEYEIDKTHIIKEDEDWWINVFGACGLKVKSFSYSMGAIKEHWITSHKYGNGFFIVEK